MEGQCLEGLIAEVIVAEWHCLDADFLYHVPFLSSDLL